MEQQERLAGIQMGVSTINQTKPLVENTSKEERQNQENTNCESDDYSS